MNNNFEGEDFYGPPKLVWLGLISGLMVFFLYLISPNDVSESLPSPYASRYLWSPLIPILITISITTLCLASFLDMLYGKFLVISVNFIFFLILFRKKGNVINYYRVVFIKFRKRFSRCM